MPSPTNAEITLTANAQLGDLDAHAHLMPILSYRLLLHAQASTMTGPMQIPIDNDEWQPGIGVGGLLELFTAGWVLGTTNAYFQPLDVTTRAQVEFLHNGYLSDTPSEPRYVWMDRGWLFVYPAVQSEGYLSINAREGVGDWLDDSEPLRYIPPTYQSGFADMVACKRAEGTPDDAEMAKRLQTLVPRAAVARQRIMTWAANQNRGSMHGMRPAPYRRAML